MEQSPSVTARLLESGNDRRLWHEMSENSRAGSMQQCFWWTDPLKRCGVRTRGIGLWKENSLVGGGLFRSIPIPCLGAHLTQCLSGPLFSDWKPEWADQFIPGVVDLARDDDSMEVAIHGCANREVHRGLVDAFRRRGLKITFQPGAVEAVLSLEDATPEALWRAMSAGTRRKIRKAQRHAVEIRTLASGADLRKAHAAWMATAARKGFTDIRPWDMLEPVLRYCVDNGRGTVYASFMNGELLAAIFVVYFGGHASYVYGGFLEGGERWCPNHILHFEAINNCLARGIKTYNFGNLTSSGDEGRGGSLDRFKLGFGSRPKRRLDSIIWRRRPLLAGCCAWLQRRRAFGTVAAALKRRLLSGSAQG